MSKQTSLTRLLVGTLALIAFAQNPVWGATRLAKKTVQCQDQDLNFKSVLNSNHIHYEPLNPNDQVLQAYDIEVDKTSLQGEEVYLNYMKKECPQTTAINPKDCVFHFAIYRVLPDQTVEDTKDFLYMDFRNGELVLDQLKNSGPTIEKLKIPSRCQDMATAYLERENQLNQAYSQKN